MNTQSLGKLINMVSLAHHSGDTYAWADLDEKIHEVFGGEDYGLLIPKYMDSMYLVCNRIEMYSGIRRFHVTKEESDSFYIARVELDRMHFEAKGLFPQTALLAALLSYIKWQREEFDMLLRM